MRKQAISGLVGSLGLIGAVFATVPAGAAAASGSNAGGASDQAHACPAPQAGTASCNAIQLLNPAQNWRGDRVSPGGHGSTSSSTVNPSGYHPADLLGAYNLTAASSASTSQTVAIVDAYDDPSAASDLNTYRSTFGLPALNAGGPTFTKRNQSGVVGSYPRANGGWAEEISLDLDMVSAICPHCNILLVEASSNSNSNLAAAVDTAAKFGATEISNSYGGSDSSNDSTYDSHYDHPGIAVTASSGDSGYGVEYPASSPYVTAVGGTTLQIDRSTNPATYVSEKAWSSAGSGCSSVEGPETWQQKVSSLSAVCPSGRAVADVSADADPNTGVSVYDSYHEPGWLVFGGTSVASPVIASVYALAGGVGSSVNNGSVPYGNPTMLHPVTLGSNGSCGDLLCEAGTPWDGPTGLGTPDGTGAF